MSDDAEGAVRQANDGGKWDGLEALCRLFGEEACFEPDLAGRANDVLTLGWHFA